jgi:hypothetical protein
MINLKFLPLPEHICIHFCQHLHTQIFKNRQEWYGIRQSLSSTSVTFADSKLSPFLQNVTSSQINQIQSVYPMALFWKYVRKRFVIYFAPLYVLIFQHEKIVKIYQVVTKL